MRRRGGAQTLAGGAAPFDFNQVSASQVMADLHSTGASWISSIQQLLLSEFDHQESSAAGLETPDNMLAPADYLPHTLSHFFAEFSLA